MVSTDVIAPAVEFSNTPPHTHRHPTLMNSMPDTTGSDDAPAAAPQVPLAHRND